MSRLKSMVLWKSAFLTGLCAVAVFGLWWWGLVHSVETQGHARAEDALTQMQQTIAREFRRAEQTGLSFGAWWRQADGRLDNPESLQNVIPFLEKGAIITNLILSRADGDSACIVRKDGEWNLVLFRGGRDPKRFLVQNGHWAPGPMPGQEVYDAGERHWYQFGAAQTAPAWTPEAYRYYTSPVAGYTFTVPVRNAAGQLTGVIGVDVSLEELTRLIWEHQPTPGTRMMATDRAGRLLVPPLVEAMRTPENRYAQHLRPLAPELLQNLQQEHMNVTEGEGTALLDPHKDYLGATSSFESRGTPSLNLHIAIPKEDLFPGQRRYAALTFLLALAAVAGLAWTLHDLHHRVVRPMHQLAAGIGPKGGESLEPTEFNSDIWELQRVGEELQLASKTRRDMTRLMRQVEHSQRVDSVGAMAPGIVHDVNNQLTMVLGQITICRTLLDAHPELQPHLREAEGATIKCAEVLRALMDYSRPNRGNRELLSMNVVVEGAATLLQRVIGKVVRIELDLARDIPLLYGEPVKLQQVLVNLGLNARDAMPSGGRLCFRTSREGEYVCLEVTDTGCGMSEDVRQRIFEPFFTTKAPDKGTGLGLAMVANIISAHGGRIAVTSEPDQGTCFHVTFPPSLRKRGEQVTDSAAVLA